jgi:epoxyqueuosine reductase
MNTARITQLIKDEVNRLGFLSCGISKAKELTEDAQHLEKWLNKGFHGDMKYMENHFELRIDPRKLIENAKSVITLLYNYYPEEKQKSNSPKIAKYAYGTDYHYVIREKLNQLLSIIQEKVGEVNGRGFVDSAPVLERSWAKHSGLGWIGKNANLISKQKGSFFFIATLIVDIELEFDHAFKTDHCGTCTKCIDACPTNAILLPQVIDSNKCISYLTIEYKEDFSPIQLSSELGGWAFGCDVCQDVCPWNRFSKPHNEPHFNPIPEILNMNFKDWESLSISSFKQVFKNSPIARTKWKGMMRNIKAIQRNEI